MSRLCKLFKVFKSSLGVMFIAGYETHNTDISTSSFLWCCRFWCWFCRMKLKSKFSTQSCVRCAFLFNVDKSWLYELWWVWTQWWQAWNWFPLCNSSDQINRFALHCWFDLCWSSDCHRHCHHCIGSMFNDLSILTPLFIHDCQTDLEFYFILNLVCAVLRACSCVCPVFITTTQPICLHASFYQPQDTVDNAICKS